MFAKKLKELMAEMRITQSELAAKSGLTKSGISQYMSGKNKPTPKSVGAIADALGVPAEYFSDYIPPEPGEGDVYSALPVKLSVAQAAKIMGVGAEMIRINLQRGKLPFGYAMIGRTGKQYSYFISTRRFMEYAGVTEDEILQSIM